MGTDPKIVQGSHRVRSAAFRREVLMLRCEGALPLAFAPLKAAAGCAHGERCELFVSHCPGAPDPKIVQGSHRVRSEAFRRELIVSRCEGALPLAFAPLQGAAGRAHGEPPESPFRNLRHAGGNGDARPDGAALRFASELRRRAPTRLRAPLDLCCAEAPG